MDANTAKQFKDRRQASYTITLPQSQLDVTVREVDAMDLAANGQIPDTLSRHVWENLDDLTAGKTAEEHRRLLAEHTELVAVACCAMLVEPRMVMVDPGPDEIEPTDLPYVDREFLWNLACGQGRLADLHRFREQQAGAVEVAPDGADVRPAAVGDPGPQAG